MQREKEPKYEAHRRFSVKMAPLKDPPVKNSSPLKTPNIQVNSLTGLPPTLKSFIEKLEDINSRYEALTDDAIIAGKGAALYKELQGLLITLKPLRESYQELFFDELTTVSNKYNELIKLIPTRVNSVLEKANQNLQRNSRASTAGSCGKCGKPLSGDVVEAANSRWHLDCFSCFDCGRKLIKTCLNIENKPYCDNCGRKAFVRSKLKK